MENGMPREVEMGRFIRLTNHITGGPLLINVDKVLSIGTIVDSGENKTYINFGDGELSVVLESVDSILNIMKNKKLD